ncbi:MAG: spore maturation protein [Magnetococcales bacterium]|nr:spore maturation protein [Magnetococcales bacterium]MBF0148922.1 spore maturation protein [Magnetococcales bacterium]MBF0347589.1 spore maturation protein [Magnetococcales bacterium]MBF0630121.1 spore maturation protein [Magnetococcales bacterium]
MNTLFSLLVFIAFATAGYRQWQWVEGDGKAPMELLTSAMVDTAASSVTLALGLIGVMALFLGLMKVAEKGGVLILLARLIRPLMVRLFPEVPPDHPAMGAMIMNMSANALGLGNAATPFGIRAMHELDRLNPHKGTATNAMALFLAINTSSVTLLPTSVIALRASAHSNDPAAILPTTLFATFCSTLVAIIAVKGLQRFFPVHGDSGLEAQTVSSPADPMEDPSSIDDGKGYPAWVSLIALFGLVGIIPLTIFYGRSMSPWIIPGMMVALLLFGLWRRVAVYEAFVEGAREGFDVAIRIIPYLVAILVAISMFRASLAMDFLVSLIAPWTAPWGLPAEALPMAFLRPLSGSGAYGLMASLLQDPAIGPDSYTGMLVSTIQGSSETTFYVLAVYFGAVGVTRMRHTLAAALLSDVVAVMASVAICTWLFQQSH